MFLKFTHLFDDFSHACTVSYGFYIYTFADACLDSALFSQNDGIN